jgi:hypothetical protein
MDTPVTATDVPEGTIVTVPVPGIDVHVPPPTVQTSVIDCPTQTCVGPVIGGGVVLTVTIRDLAQPVTGNV